VNAEETRQLKSFKRMQKRLLKAEKIKQSERFDQMQDLFLKVHPGGVWQERSSTLACFMQTMAGSGCPIVMRQ
jgi:hypothetical protein